MKPAKLLSRLFLVANIVLLINVAAAEFVHPASGIPFPDNIAGMNRIGIADYESRSPGMGVGVSYRRGVMSNKVARIKADIYLYKGGNPNIPAGPNSNIIKKYFDNAISEIVAMEKLGHYQSVVELSRGPAKIGKKVFRAVTFSFVQKNVKRKSHLYIAGYRNHILKVRFTAVMTETESGEKEFSEFKSAFAKIIDAQSKSKNIKK